MKLSEKVLVVFTAITVIYPGWFYNNGHVDYADPLPYFSVGLLSLLLISPAFDKRDICTNLISILKDPVFYLGFFLLTFVAVQYINSGAVRTFMDGKVIFSPLKFPDLPFSVNEISARRMVYWGGTGLSVILTVRHGLSYKSRLKLLRLLLINGFILAVFGFVQHYSGTDKMFWLHDNKGDYVFSTFGYENFGGAFFTLMTTIVCGAIIHYFFKKTEKKPWKISLLFALLPVFSLAIFLCHTRFAYLELIGIFAVFAFELFWVILKKVGRTPAAAVFMIVLAVGVGSASFVQKSDHYVADDLRVFFDGTERLKHEFQARTWQWEAAVKIWRDYLIFGNGHDSARYIQTLYLPDNYYQLSKAKGKANTHNDFLQYLSELGIVGMSLLFAVFILLISQACSNKFWRNRLLLWCALGIFLNAFHALIDLPYRNCLIVLTTAAVLAIISKGETDPESSVQKSGNFLRMVICLFAVIGLTYSLSGFLLPLKKSNALELLEQSKTQADIFMKVKLLTRAESIHPFIDDVRYALALALFDLYKKNGDKKILDKAVYYIHQSRMRDNKNLDVTLNFADIMTEVPHIWEVEKVLMVQLAKYPKDERIYNAFEKLYQKYGFHQRLKWLENKKKNKK